MFVNFRDPLVMVANEAYKAPAKRWDMSSPFWRATCEAKGRSR